MKHGLFITAFPQRCFSDRTVYESGPWLGKLKKSVMLTGTMWATHFLFIFYLEGDVTQAEPFLLVKVIVWSTSPHQLYK